MLLKKIFKEAMVKECSNCYQVKPIDDFYAVGKTKNGDIRYNPKCKICVKFDCRERYRTDPKLRAARKERADVLRDDPDFVARNKRRGQEFYYSMEGRAKTLLKSATRRKDKHSEFDIDLDFVLEKLSKGFCEVTGIPFSYEKPVDSFNNKYSPSIDRIDSKIGYIKSNTRIVIWQYNLMKGEISDNELLEICKIMVNKELQ